MKMTAGKMLAFEFLALRIGSFLGGTCRTLVENHALRTQIREYRDRQVLGDGEILRSKPDTCPVMVIDRGKGCFQTWANQKQWFNTRLTIWWVYWASKLGPW